MADERLMRPAVRHLARLLSEYAASRGWSADRYTLYFLPDAEWGQVIIIFVGPFPADDEEHEDARFQEWERIVEFLETHLHNEPSLLHSYNLVLRTPEEVEEGGIYSIGPEYIEAQEL
jgi:hypothetical protein